MNETLKEILNICFTSNILDVIHRDLLDLLESLDLSVDDITAFYVDDDVTTFDTSKGEAIIDTYWLCVKITEICIKNYFHELKFIANNMEDEIQDIKQNIHIDYFFCLEVIISAWGNMYNNKEINKRNKFKYTGNHETYYEIGYDPEDTFDIPAEKIIFGYSLKEESYTEYSNDKLVDYITEYLCDNTIIDLVEALINCKLESICIIPEDISQINISKSIIEVYNTHSKHKKLFIFEDGIYKEMKKLIGDNYEI